jgi:high-affinity nickel-transport protein
MVHGLAGSAAVALLVLATVSDPAVALAYLLLFGLGTIAGMMLVTGLIALPASLAVARVSTARRWLTATSGVVSLVFGILLAHGLSGPDGLFSDAPVWTPH